MPARLLTRHWIITDANGNVKETRGDGVVGEQPYLKPGQGFRYSSGAVIETPVGTMQGSYQMVADDGRAIRRADRAVQAGDARGAALGAWLAMALYAIGDVQGCDDELGALLGALRFSPDRDRLWFVGDLVNRGPDSLAVLRRIRALGDAATVILGNHDLHLLAVAYGCARLRSDDTLERDPGGARSRRAARMAAGSAAAARGSRAECLHAARRLGAAMGPGAGATLRARIRRGAAPRSRKAFRAAVRRSAGSLGRCPRKAKSACASSSNCFTRLRYVDADGRLMLRAKGSPKKAQTKSLIPWFEARAGALARAAHRLRSLVDTGLFQQRRCHRPRHRLRLGRHPDGAAVRRPRRQARAGALRRDPRGDASRA